MKRRAVIKKIEQGAKSKSVSWTLHSEGANHSIYMLAGKRIPIERHTEIDDLLAEKVFKECEDILGQKVVALMRDYRVEAELGQSGRWWVISVPEVPAAHSQARRLSHVEDVARELISLMTDASPESFTVHVEVKLPDAVRRDLEQSAALREEAARAQAQAAQLARHAAALLRSQGLPLRDVGQALGVSFQRAKQLVDEAEKIAS